MEKTVNVNLGSMAFTMGEDAYLMLNRYLDDIKSRLDPDASDETMDDIEGRIADIFAESLRLSNQVVTMIMVRDAIERMGKPSTFGHRQQRAYSSQPKRFFRSRKDCVLGGICGGVASYFDLDVSLVRIVAFILIFFGGISVWIYIIVWILTPKEPVVFNQQKGEHERR